MRLRIPLTGVNFDEIMLKISDIQLEFYKKYQNYKYKVLMGVSSKYNSELRSSLYYFEADGRCIPQTEFKEIGSGSPYAYYFLKRYWRENQTTMEQFAQLSDFIIRYVSDPEYRLDDAVGLSNRDDQYQYPQIVYIPDNPNFCQIYNNQQSKIDCFPHITRLNEFRHNSEAMLNMLHELPFITQAHDPTVNGLVQDP
jgi:hypothetical protein